MRKSAILILPLILMIAACTNESNTNETYVPYQPAPPTQTTQTPPPAPPAETPTPPPAAPTGPAFALTVNNFTIYMDQNIQEVLDAFGEPLGVFELPSCAFDGIDRIFSFPGLQIHTYPLDDSDFVHTVSIRDDSILTQNGIYLGNSWEDVLAAYGSDYDHEFGMFTFTKGVTKLQFLVEDDMVVAITYGLIMN